MHVSNGCNCVCGIFVCSSEEIERERLKRLISRRRKRILAMLVAMKKEELALLHASHYFAWRKAFETVFEKDLNS